LKDSYFLSVLLSFQGSFPDFVWEVLVGNCSGQALCGEKNMSSAANCPCERTFVIDQAFF
ncbi:MAG: hypothetical protein VZR02_07155, partial [Lachnospiraceae bacterium]|nr:hypothetical protein [Lachnospiraceae bacterium]